MHFTLLADRVNRAGVNTGGAIDTLIINCVGHGTFLLFGNKVCSETFPGEFTATGKFCPAQSVKLSNLKILAILTTFYYPFTTCFTPVRPYKT
jgi:hypothetical protein